MGKGWSLCGTLAVGFLPSRFWSWFYRHLSSCVYLSSISKFPFGFFLLLLLHESFGFCGRLLCWEEHLLNRHWSWFLWRTELSNIEIDLLHFVGNGLASNFSIYFFHNLLHFLSSCGGLFFIVHSLFVQLFINVHGEVLWLKHWQGGGWFFLDLVYRLR